MRNQMKSTVVAAATVAISLSSTAMAETVMKAGEWVMTIQAGAMGATGGGPMSHNICFKTDKTPADLGNRRAGMKNCNPPTVSTNGDTATVDVACKGPMGGNMTIHAVVTSLGPDSFREETEMKMDNPPQGMPGSMKMVTEAKRTGPCQPGDQEVN
jgi:hypothetical protein